MVPIRTKKNVVAGMSDFHFKPNMEPTMEEEDIQDLESEVTKPRPSVVKRKKKKVRDPRRKERLFLRTENIAPLTRLMYGMKHMMREIRFHVREDGMVLSEGIDDDTMYIFIRLEASQFLEYDSNRPEGRESFLVCFHPDDLYTFIANAQHSDIMSWTYDACEDPDVLRVQLRRAEGCVTYTYEMPLLHSETEAFETPPVEIPLIFAFNPSLLGQIIGQFIAINEYQDWVTIEGDSNGIEFRMDNASTLIPRARFALVTRRPETEGPHRTRRNRKRISDAEVSVPCRPEFVTEKISHEFRLGSFEKLLKCFSVDKNMLYLYLKKDYPLILEFHISMLGKLRAALMFKTSGEEIDPVDETMGGSSCYAVTNH